MFTDKEMKQDVLERFMKINRLFHQYHQQCHMHDGPFGDLRRGQGRVLAILNMKPVMTQKELSFLLEMKPQSLGELLGKLEKKAFITRQPSKTDRRVMEIRLTDEGKKALKQRQEKNEAPSLDLMEALDEDEQKQLEVLLDKLILHVEGKFGKVESGPENFFGHRHQQHGHGHHHRFREE